MRDVELYQHLMGLGAPWTVSKVELNAAAQRVDVWVTHPEEIAWPCPKCSAEGSLYDHEGERMWRHLDSCQFHTFLHARPPRVTCATHGVRQVRLPWSEPNSRFTALFETLGIDVLRETDVKGAGQILGLSWDEAWHIEERAVQRGRAAKETHVIARLSVDEKAVAKGHEYMTIVCDIDAGTVEYVADGRKKEALDGFFRGLTPEQLNGIVSISMDMWEPFIASAREHLPDADSKIVFDRFHIMKHMNEAVDKVRRWEHRLLQRSGDDALKGSKHLWLYGKENVPAKHRSRFGALKSLNLKTGRAWAIKESLRALWEYKTPGWAFRHWKQWYHWAMSSRLAPVKDTARMIKDHLANVLTFITHRVTTATSEGTNSRIEMIKHRACGYRNRANFTTTIFFHCGGLALYPSVG